MASLSHILPPPTIITHDRDQHSARAASQQSRALVSTKKTIPTQGKREGWIPRAVEDFGDGGAFPEIQVAQYPLEMGRKREGKTNALAVAVDDTGSIKYDALLRQGQAKDKVIHSKYQDLVPKPIRNESAPEYQKPSEEEIAKLTQETQQALQLRVESKIEAAMPVRRVATLAPDQYVRYTPSQQGSNHNSGATQRIVRVVEQQHDPMEPPKFKINRKLPKGPPSPPAPVMHSPPRKVTVQEQADWKIPPCISNWKNAKGYTIPLDKRLAADGRGLQQVHINENFAKLAEALYIADRKAREAVEVRAQLERKLAQKEKEKKEEHLRQLAQKAREERAGIRTAQPSGEDEAAQARERDQLRYDRHKERARDRNIERAAPDKRNKLQKDRERDISEKIALGLPAKGAQSDDQAFDQRLFNQSKGMDSGFAGGDDEVYNVYDKAWRSEKNIGQSIYRPSKNTDKEVYGDDIDEIIKTNRFVPDKGFEGADKAGKRSGPVQFEKHGQSSSQVEEREADPFGLDKFLGEAKKGAKRTEDDRRKASPERGRDRDHDRKKRRGD